MTKLKILDRLLIGGAILAILYIASISDIFVKLRQNIKYAPVNYELEQVATGLNNPWSLAFLPNGDMLVTERGGTLYRIPQKTKIPTPVSGVQPIAIHGQGGLLDVLPDPDFASNHLIYMTHAAPDTAPNSSLVTTALTKARLDGNTLRDVTEIFRLPKPSATGIHFGSRLVFGKDGFLYVTLGERGDRPRAQDKSDPAGGIIRIKTDGSAPADNPFHDDKTAHPAIYSIGSRNPQGIALHPVTGKIWFHEHGPRGGDEINILEAGANYGWPRISHGKEYDRPQNVGEANEAAWVKPPLHIWIPSIAPSGMAFYTGDDFPAWKGSLFVGALAGTHLARLTLDGEKIIDEERLLTEQDWRIRDVRQGPDGFLYLLFDEPDSGVFRLRPQRK